MNKSFALFGERIDAVLPYLLALLLPGFVQITRIQLPDFGVIINPFLLFLTGIVLVAYYGGLRPAVIATLSSVVVLYFPNIYPSIRQFSTDVILNTGIFIFLGILIGFIVEFYKRTDTENIFKQKERIYKKQLQKLLDEKAQLHKEIKARDEFLSIASHELKTPLTSMLLQLQHALHSIKNVSLAEFSVQDLVKKLDSAEQQIIRLAKMINDLLNVSLITTGRLDLEVEKVDLSEVVKTVVERFSEKLEKIGVVIQADTPVVGNWDRLRLEQVITNLISNAIKYGDNKPIEVRVDTDGSYGRVRIKDSGIGISKENQHRIFERFERAVSDASYKGLGVGLYISSQIIKAHKGLLSVKSNPAKGSEFIVKLPL